MTGAEVARFVAYLEEAGVRIWLDGGWGVDALVGEETRAAAISMQLSSWTRWLRLSLLSRLGFRVEVDDKPTRLVLAASDGNVSIFTCWSSTKKVMAGRSAQGPTEAMQSTLLKG